MRTSSVKLLILMSSEKASVFTWDKEENLAEYTCSMCVVVVVVCAVCTECVVCVRTPHPLLPPSTPLSTSSLPRLLLTRLSGHIPGLSVSVSVVRVGVCSITLFVSMSLCVCLIVCVLACTQRVCGVVSVCGVYIPCEWCPIVHGV